jgi:hypothetical protein
MIGISEAVHTVRELRVGATQRVKLLKLAREWQDGSVRHVADRYILTADPRNRIAGMATSVNDG